MRTANYIQNQSFNQYFLNFIFDPKSLVRLLHIKFQIFGIFPIVSHILCHVLPQFQTLFKILIYDNYNSENPKFQVSSQILGIKYKCLLELIINSTSFFNLRFYGLQINFTNYFLRIKGLLTRGRDSRLRSRRSQSNLNPEIWDSGRD